MHWVLWSLFLCVDLCTQHMVHNSLSCDEEPYVSLSLTPILSPGHHQPIHLHRFVESHSVPPFDISDNPVLRSYDLCLSGTAHCLKLVSKFFDLYVWLYRPTIISLKMCPLYWSKWTLFCFSQFVMRTKHVSTQKRLGSAWHLLIREVPFLLWSFL